MKLFTKISLIIAAVAGGIGVLAVVIGLAMGAELKDLEQMGIYINSDQVELSGVIRNELLDELEDEEHFFRDDYSSTSEYEETFEGIQRLEVDVQNANITIFAVEDSQEIRYAANRGKSIAKVNGSTLKLEEEAALKNHLKLDLYIPVGILSEMEIEASNGALTADEIIADNVSIDIDNASVKIQQLVVNNKAELQINTGELNVGYFQGPNIDLECAVGAMMVGCEGTKNDYNYNLECGVGEIILGDETYSGLGGEKRVQNGGNKLIEAECSVGRIQIAFPGNL